MSYVAQLAEHQINQAIETRDPIQVWSAIAGAVENAKALEHGDDVKAFRQASRAATSRTRTLIGRGLVDEYPVGHHLRGGR
jgi:SRSO17 transposase